MAYLTPAEAVIRAWKGVRATARRLGEDPATVCRWKKPRGKQRGTGGLLPSDLHRTILEAAQADGKTEITAEVLIHGLEIEEDADARDA